MGQLSYVGKSGNQGINSIALSFLLHLPIVVRGTVFTKRKNKKPFKLLLLCPITSDEITFLKLVNIGTLDHMSCPCLVRKEYAWFTFGQGLGARICFDMRVTE